MAGLADSPTDKALLLLPRLLLAVLVFFANNLRAEDVSLTVNVKRPVALTSDKFLSYTLVPEAVLIGNALSENLERSVNMAKALAPAYVRIGGPRSNSLTFQAMRRQQYQLNPNFTFTDEDWAIVNQWAEKAGLDVLACIAPQHPDNDGRDLGWDSRNALDLVAFSDLMKFNTSWQLGYECQKHSNLSGIDMGRNVIRLRSMLDAFPRYSRSIVTGPDVVTYRSKEQQQYLQDYLSVAGTAISAITWHPKFSSITLEPDSVSLHDDQLALEKDVLYKAGGRLMWKKPLWLAESTPENCKNQFLGALVWTRRLGDAAKLGIQVIMRQPNDGNFIQPSPDYWVSVIHKTLVGPEVFDTKIAAGNRTRVHFYCQCTKPSTKYERGSLTIFGINLAPFEIVANIKSIKIKTIHKYILMPGFDAKNRMFAETVLLNNKPLNLLNDREMPEIEPIISKNSEVPVLKLPSGGIGFWVLPGLKIKSCGGLEANNDKTLVQKLTRFPGETDSNEDVDHDGARDDDSVGEKIFIEDRRSSSKSNRNKKKKHHRHSEEDDAEKYYRISDAKMDLDRLENLLRRRDIHDAKKSPDRRPSYFGFEDKGPAKMEDEREQTYDAITAKLQNYKNRLKQIKTAKTMNAKSRDSVVERQVNDTIDSDKVVEALFLISKMENKMKNWTKSYDDDSTNTLESVVSNDSEVTNSTKNPEDKFLNELLRSKKIQRTSVPSKIEDQLRAIYEMLAEEKARRSSNLEIPTKFEEEQNVNDTLPEIDEKSGRSRREAVKKIGNDSSGSRKDELFRKRSRIEEARERRMERRRKKVKDDRKDGKPFTLNLRSSVDKENNLYGFEKREPLKNFPKGDLHLTTGTSGEVSSIDYDYVKDDDDDRDQGSSKSVRETYVISSDQSESDDTAWIEDDDNMFSHMPKELFEIAEITGPRDLHDLNKFDELLEPESNGNQWSSRDSANSENEGTTIDEIIQEPQPDAREDRRIKEVTIERLDDHYGGSKFYEKDDGFDRAGTKRFDEPGSDVRHEPSHSNPSSVTIDQDPIEILHMNPTASTNDKLVRDSRSIEFRSFGNYDSVKSSSEFPIEDIQEFEIPGIRPVSGSERSVDNAEPTSRIGRKRRNRWLFGKTGSPITNPDNRFVENSRTTRSKRQARSFDKETEDIISKEEAKIVKEMESAQTFDTTSLDGKDKDHEIASSVVDNGKAIAALGKDHVSAQQDLTDGKRVSDVPAIEDVDSAIKTESQDIKTNDSVKSDNRETRQHISSQRPSKFFGEGGECTKEVRKPTETKVIEDSTKHSKTDQDFSENVKDNSRTFDKSTPTNLAKKNPKFNRSLVNLKTSTAENEVSAVEHHSCDQETKTDDYSDPTDSGSNVNDKNAGEEIVRKTGKKIVVDRMSGVVEYLPKDSQRLRNNVKGRSRISAKKSSELKIQDNDIGHTPRSKKNFSSGKGMVKLARSTKDNAKITRKTSQRTKQPMRDVDSRKARAAQIFEKSEAPRRSNGSKKVVRSLEYGSKILSNESCRSKKSCDERTEKLLVKLRRKKAKMTQERRDELLNEREKTGNPGGRNLKRRDIINMISNDEELRELVDPDKFDGMLENESIDVKDVSDDCHLDDSTVEIDVDRDRSKSYHSIVDSSEDPEIHRHSSEFESGEKKSIENFQSDESDVRELLRVSVEKSVDDVIKPNLIEDDNVEEQNHRDYRSRHATPNLQNKMAEEWKSSNYESRFAKNALNKKNHDTWTKEHSDKDIVKNREKRRAEVVKEIDYRMTVPVKNGSANQNEKYVSKMKYVKDSDYEKSKYKYSKFARLDPKKMEGRRRGESKNNRETMEDHRAVSLNGEDPTKKMTSEDSRWDTVNGSSGHELSSGERKMEDSTQLKTKLDVIDDLDLEEALNSSKFELLVVIPMRNHKKNRRRRHLEEEILEYDANLASNELPLDAIQILNEDKSRNMILGNIGATDANTMDSILTKILQDSTYDNDPDDNSIFETSVIDEVKNFKPSTMEKSRLFDDQEPSELVEIAIPGLETTVTDYQDETRQISESFEKFIDGFDDKLSQKHIERKHENPTSIEITKPENEAPIIDDIFNTAVKNVKIFFDFCLDFFRAIRFN